MERRNLALEALDAAYQEKVAQLYDTLLNAMTVSPDNIEAQLDACDRFVDGLKVATSTHKHAIELIQAHL